MSRCLVSQESSRPPASGRACCQTALLLEFRLWGTLEGGSLRASDQQGDLEIERGDAPRRLAAQSARVGRKRLVALAKQVGPV